MELRYTRSKTSIVECCFLCCDCKSVEPHTSLLIMAKIKGIEIFCVRNQSSGRCANCVVRWLIKVFQYIQLRHPLVAISTSCAGPTQCVCTFVCVYVCMYVCVHVYAYAYVYVYVYVYAGTRVSCVETSLLSTTIFLGSDYQRVTRR